MTNVRNGRAAKVRRQESAKARFDAAEAAKPVLKPKQLKVERKSQKSRRAPR